VATTKVRNAIIEYQSEHVSSRLNLASRTGASRLLSAHLAEDNLSSPPHISLHDAFTLAEGVWRCLLAMPMAAQTPAHQRPPDTNSKCSFYHKSFAAATTSIPPCHQCTSTHSPHQESRLIFCSDLSLPLMPKQLLHPHLSQPWYLVLQIYLCANTLKSGKRNMVHPAKKRYRRLRTTQRTTHKTQTYETAFRSSIKVPRQTKILRQRSGMHTTKTMARGWLPLAYF
jgi:hypothetical protein